MSDETTTGVSAFSETTCARLAAIEDVIDRHRVSEEQADADKKLAAESLKETESNLAQALTQARQDHGTAWPETVCKSISKLHDDRARREDTLIKAQNQLKRIRQKIGEAMQSTHRIIGEAVRGETLFDSGKTPVGADAFLQTTIQDLSGETIARLFAESDTYTVADLADRCANKSIDEDIKEGAIRREDARQACEDASEFFQTTYPDSAKRNTLLEACERFGSIKAKTAAKSKQPDPDAEPAGAAEDAEQTEDSDSGGENDWYTSVNIGAAHLQDGGAITKTLSPDWAESGRIASVFKYRDRFWFAAAKRGEESIIVTCFEVKRLEDWPAPSFFAHDAQSKANVADDLPEDWPDHKAARVSLDSENGAAYVLVGPCIDFKATPQQAE